jgi:hypothetical protein
MHRAPTPTPDDEPFREDDTVPINEPAPEDDPIPDHKPTWRACQDFPKDLELIVLLV